jgi:hypothetical protein
MRGFGEVRKNAMEALAGRKELAIRALNALTPFSSP